MLTAVKTLGIIFFPAYDWAISPTHPERQERLLYTQDQLVEEGLFDIGGVTEYKPDIACEEDVRKVHFCFPDVSGTATESHLISAGGALKAAGLVMEGEKERAFALVRPPGHHAMKVVHGQRGFCAINIEAVMIEHIRETWGVKRIAIVDTDCHHGDGTQDIYWNDPDVLFISMHQDGRTMFPGTGFPNEIGGPNAAGKILNVPLPPGTSDPGFMNVMEYLVMPALEHFKPELVINSAGQDNHYTDPITNMKFTARGYARLNEMLSPDIAVLEGGYSIKGALPYINLGICLAMSGLDYGNVREPDYDPERIKEDPKITEYAKIVSEEIFKKVYLNPPDHLIEGERRGDYHVRVKDIYYDTDQISEKQVESLRLCNNCSGMVKYESTATNNGTCLGIYIPLNACEKCVEEGHRLAQQARSDTRYRHVQLTDRVNKVFG